MAVTIKHVAKAAGVNDSTVSRALRDDPRLRASTRRRIRAVACQMKYRVHPHARRLATGAIENIGVAVGVEIPIRASHTLAALDWLDELDGEIGKRGLNLQIAARPILAPLSGGQVMLPRFLTERHFDGLIVANHITVMLAQALRESQVPFVAINARRVEGVCTVNIAEEKTTELLVRHFSGLGHRRIAFVNADHDTGFRSRLRATGYARGMEAEGLPLFRGWNALGNNEKALEDLLDCDDPPTAVITYDDGAAFGLDRLLALRGLRAGRDVSFASAQFLARSPSPMVSLTRMNRPSGEMTRLAIEALLAILDGRPEDARSVTLDPELEVGRSTGPPAQIEEALGTRKGGRPMIA